MGPALEGRRPEPENSVTAGSRSRLVDMVWPRANVTDRQAIRTRCGSNLHPEPHRSAGESYPVAARGLSARTDVVRGRPISTPCAVIRRTDPHPPLRRFGGGKAE